MNTHSGTVKELNERSDSEESRGSALAENTVVACDSAAVMDGNDVSDDGRKAMARDRDIRGATTLGRGETATTTRKGNDDRKREVDVKSSHCSSYRSCGPWLKEYTCKVR